MREANSSRRLRRGIYLLPSLFTIGNVLLGFVAVVQGLEGDFTDAALAVFAAAFLDALDGRIARMTGTESEFGAEFDSLADGMTFGFAPALLAYLWGLSEFERLGWIVPIFYTVCALTRLARFNIQTPRTDSRDFVGLPTPAAAGTVASVLFFAPDAEWRTWIAAFVLVAMTCLAALMVSTFRYAGPRRVDFRSRRSYRFALPLAAVVLLIVLNPPAVLVSLAIVYTLSGPAAWLWSRVRLVRRRWRRRGDVREPTET